MLHSAIPLPPRPRPLLRPIAYAPKQSGNPCSPGVIVGSLLGVLLLFGALDQTVFRHHKATPASSSAAVGLASYGTSYSGAPSAAVTPGIVTAAPLTTTYTPAPSALPTYTTAPVLPALALPTMPVVSRTVAAPVISGTVAVPAAAPAVSVMSTGAPPVVQPAAATTTPSMSVTTTSLTPEGTAQTTTTTTTYLTPGQAQAIITASNKNESDGCLSLPSCQAYVADCSIWSSMACTNVMKTCTAVLGPPSWPGSNCTDGNAAPKWPFTYAMTPLQLAQYNCCLVQYREKTTPSWRAMQHTKGAPPIATIATDGTVTMAPISSPPPPRRFGTVTMP